MYLFIHLFIYFLFIANWIHINRSYAENCSTMFYSCLGNRPNSLLCVCFIKLNSKEAGRWTRGSFARFAIESAWGARKLLALALGVAHFPSLSYIIKLLMWLAIQFGGKGYGGHRDCGWGSALDQHDLVANRIAGVRFIEWGCRWTKQRPCLTSLIQTRWARRRWIMMGEAGIHFCPKTIFIGNLVLMWTCEHQELIITDRMGLIAFASGHWCWEMNGFHTLPYVFCIPVWRCIAMVVWCSQPEPGRFPSQTS